MNFTAEELIAEAERRYREGGVFRRYFTEANTRDLYPKHWQFFDAGAKYRQRLFRAANRVGKSTAFGTELTYHLTGRYPKDWKGKRFQSATTWWVCGKSNETVRQILQPMLLGEIGNFGTGLIPKDDLDFESLTDAKKAATGISSFKVKHIDGGHSLAEFKSYDQGRQAFEGTARSIWLDEEPPEDVYSECLLRTMTGDNILALTFTPLKGASKVVMSFTKDGSFEEGEVGAGKHVTTATWDDVPHLSEEVKTELLASIPPYQRDARSKGTPMLGSGAIFPVQEDLIFVEPFELPKHWKRFYGMDVGWNRTAAIWGAIDPDADVTYYYAEHYVGEAVPSTHAAAIKARGAWIPGAIDPAARGRGQDDGQKLFDQYKDLGLNLTKADNTVETNLWEMLEAMQQGRLKFFNTLVNFKKEFRSYSRDEKGKVIKANDHICDAARYGWSTGRSIAIVEQKRINNPNLGRPTVRTGF